MITVSYNHHYNNYASYVSFKSNKPNDTQNNNTEKGTTTSQSPKQKYSDLLTLCIIKLKCIFDNNTQNKDTKNQVPIEYSTSNITYKESSKAQLIEDEYLKKAKDGSMSESDYIHWEQLEYNRLRKINNSNVPNDKLQTAINLQKDGIMLVHLNGWIYRTTSTINHSEYRASLNVVNSPQLIEELDNFMLTGEYTMDNKKYQVKNKTNFFYKTHQNAAKWYTREDPISIYFDDEVNDETYSAITNITKKYRNAALHNAQNQDVYWFITEKCPDGNMIIPLINEALQTDYMLGKAIYDEATNGGKQYYSLSSAEFEAYYNILNKIKAYLNS